MFSKFSEEAQKALLLAKDEMVQLKHPYVGSEHLFLAILSNKKQFITNKLKSFDITYETFRDEIVRVVGMGSKSNNWFLYTPLLKKIIENAIFDTKEKGIKEVGVEQLFLSMLEEGDGVAIRILIGMGIDIDSLYNEFNSKLLVKKNKKEKRLIVNEFSVNFNKKAMSKEIDPVVCRDMEVNRIIEILSRRCKNNPLLIGEAGVGKTAIVEEISRRIVNGDVPKFLQNKKILSISIASLVAGTKYRGEFEERINKILKEVESDGNIILFIDEIHTIVGAGGAEGAIDASNILKPSLARGQIRIIGATTTGEYKQSIEKDKALDRRFQKVEVKEPTCDSTLEILMSLRPIYSDYHHVKISDDVLSYIVQLTDRYICNQKNPDKSIDILDEVCAKASLNVGKVEREVKDLNKKLKSIIKSKNDAVMNQDFKKAAFLKNEQCVLEDLINRKTLKSCRNVKMVTITKKQVSEVVELKTKIPIYEISKNNNVIVNKLRKRLTSAIVGQEEIIEELCNFTKLMKSGISRDRAHSFLLVGSTGCGKTMLVKEYAEGLFGGNNFIRLDMSEYKEEHSISKIIGSPPGYVGYDDMNFVLEKVRNNPHSVLLLDEVEKAHPSVVKLFLQVLDDGVMHDALGREINFKNTIIFMTSNIGCGKKNLGFNEVNTNTDMKDFFSVEFLNRVDKVFTFKSISYDNMKKIVVTKLKTMQNEYNKKNIVLSFSTDIVDKIIKKSNYLEYGARKVDKIIEDVINRYILDMIINGKNEICLMGLEV